MKNKAKISLVSSVIILSFYLAGCSNFLSPNSSTANTISVKITSPVSNDSVSYKGNTVSYQYTSITGLYAVELHTIIAGVDNATWFSQNPDGTNPEIPLTFDSTLIGSRISIYLIYYDQNNSSIASDTVKNILIKEITAPPYPPYDVTVTQLSPTSVNVAWKDSSLIPSGFEVYRRLGFTGSWVLAATAPPGAFNVNDSGLSAYQVYGFKVVAINKFGSAESQVVDNSGAYYTGNLYPPTNLTANALSKNVVKLDWKDNSSNENYFKVERRYSFSNYQTIANLDKNTTTFNDSLVIGGTEYIYRIKAYSASDSAWSNEAVITTPVSKSF